VLPPISSISPDELRGWLTANGQPAYRAAQVRTWLAAGVASFADMRNLPAALREALAGSFRLSSLEEVTRSDVEADGTTKVLFALDGGSTVESVLMRYPSRSTLCISSQVGCPIGCPFCASGQGAFGRNLKAHEIVDQALEANRRLLAEGRRLTHVVFMGMGEPLANYDAVMAAVRAIADHEQLGISPRRITISTSGLVPRMERLADEGLPFTLAISLHAARNDLRDELVPINRRYPLEVLLPAARSFAERTGRRVSYEYVLLAGVNDTARDARELGERLDRRLAHVNLIPFNPVDDTPYTAPTPREVRRFAAAVAATGLNVTVRDTKGRSGDAACGQLRQRVKREEAAAARAGA
jgi:23S rRNA (adenine2503-C2)-methyltransferase